MKILMVGDIVGSPGRLAFARIAGQMKSKGQADFIIANAENAAGGRGLTPARAGEIFDAGADVITTGDHVWDQKEIINYLDREPRILRPANFPPGCPGKGFITVRTAAGPLTVIDLVGRTFMPPNDCPFRAAEAILARGAELGRMIFVEFHAEATSEKGALGRFLDGRVTAVAGTHTHVQTADECILPKGTAYLTEIGMTGPRESVIGREIAPVLAKFTPGMPSKFEIATADVRLDGVLITVDAQTGRAKDIKRIQEAVVKP